MIIHVVAPGDTLYRISQKHSVSMDTIINDNDLQDPNLLLVGQALIIRRSNVRHVVKPNETLSMLAGEYNIPLVRLYRTNNLNSESVIYPGDIININFDNTDKIPMEINGYVYPNQDINILKEMLPFLTYLSIFSYTVNSDGSINSIPDEELIKLARSYNVAPMMVITNIDSNDTFNSDLARSILTNEAAQDKLITNILINLKAKNYYGLDVDFEFIYPEDKVKYNNFLRKVVDALHPKGYKVSTAVAPKTSTDMTGLLYEAHDYEAHGKIVDRIIIMTYEWGYTYSEAMPVAPLDRVQEVIEYAVTVIPNDKILMGIPNYGYDFRVPRLEDEPATSISNFEAIQIGRENLVAIEFDDEAMSPYFNYMNKDVVREVHFEDARSIKEKILLAIEYDLAGLSFWTLRTNFKPTWILIDYYLDVIKLI